MVYAGVVGADGAGVVFWGFRVVEWVVKAELFSELPDCRVGSFGGARRVLPVCVEVSSYDVGVVRVLHMS